MSCNHRPHSFVYCDGAKSDFLSSVQTQRSKQTAVRSKDCPLLPYKQLVHGTSLPDSFSPSLLSANLPSPVFLSFSVQSAAVLGVLLSPQWHRRTLPGALITLKLGRPSRCRRSVSGRHGCSSWRPTMAAKLTVDRPRPALQVSATRPAARPSWSESEPQNSRRPPAGLCQAPCPRSLATSLVTHR